MYSQETAFKLVCKLVKDFSENESKYLSPEYSEAEVRKDYVDKFFIALGWDVNHDTQKNPYEQEVKIEKGVSVGKQQKRADYAFHLAPNFRDVKFYIEAKKPSRNIHNADDYFQSCRYGWNAGTQITFLTDFEEFIILDCRIRPDINSVLSNKIKSYHYTDYSNEEKFAEIYWLISREAVAANSLEKYAESLSKPKGKAIQKGLFKGGYQSIDEAFLEELDEIRDTLAKAFKKANPHLGSEELTEMTQRTIDRLVFIRFLEDKLIEPEHYVSEFEDSKTAWKDFSVACRKLDAKYNGIVFKKHFLDSNNFVEPDNTTFTSICEELAHVNSPYNFDIIPIHILGSIYERFLGKVVIATDKRVRIEEKPEVRKAGGVYYTPQYIVKYIVENTVGKLIEGKTPKDIAKMRFADISCGSGSFLITVFDRLLEYHRKWYQANPQQAKKDGCILQDGVWVLSLKQKQKILTNNIYGVDLDPQAVEVTQVSLYLKLLEDETMATANDMQVLFKEQILPSLNNNIICGNSLISTDILENSLFENENEIKLKPMNFKEVFPVIMKEGGFDAIVGNPPYIRIQILKEEHEILEDYLKRNYQSAKIGNYDLYVVFVEKSLNSIKDKGKIGYILPNKFFNSKYGIGIRNKITSGKYLEKIIHFGSNQIFKDATTYTTILILSNELNEEFNYLKVKDLELWKNNLHCKDEILPFSALGKNEWNLVGGKDTGLYSKLNRIKTKLEDISDIFVGLQTSADKVFILNKISETKNTLTLFSDALNKEIIVEKPLFKALLSGTDVKRYQMLSDRQYILFPYRIVENRSKLIPFSEIEDNYPKTAKYLMENIQYLENREHGKMKNINWYGYIYLKNMNKQEIPKICVPRLVQKLQAVFDHSGEYYLDNVDVGGITLKLEYNNLDMRFLLALINSKLLSWYFPFISAPFRGGWMSANKQYLSQLPIMLGDNKSFESSNKIIQLVDQMHVSKVKLANAKTASEKEYWDKKCSSIDVQIDQIVYDLYGLTEEEIQIVENCCG